MFVEQIKMHAHYADFMQIEAVHDFATAVPKIAQLFVGIEKESD